MRDHPERQPFGGLPQELARLVSAVSAFEVRLAGDLGQETSERLERLALASRYLAAAQAALAGVPVADRAPEEDHLQGTSRAVPIQDLLCFLSTTQKSGILRVEAESERYLLQLDQGSVVYATGDAPPTGQGLSDLLSQRGVLSAELLGSLPADESAGRWVDPNLVGTSWIARDSLLSAIQEQTRLAFFRLCSAHHTRFRFYEGAWIQNVVPIKQSAVELLLEYSRVQDEGLEGRERPLLCAPESPAPPRPTLTPDRSSAFLGRDH